MKLDEINYKTKVEQLILSPIRTISGDGSPVTIFAEINER